MAQARRTLLLSAMLVTGGSLLAACGGTAAGPTATTPAPSSTASPSATPSPTATASSPATPAVTSPAGTAGRTSPPVTVTAKVWFLDLNHAKTGEEPLFRPVSRQVQPPAVAAGALDALFAGPTEAEKAGGLKLLTSGATGYAKLRIQDGIAYVTLQGACSSGGSTMTIAGEIMPTLKQFASVTHVKIYAPDGTTGSPAGASDSIPFCLEP